MLVGPPYLWRMKREFQIKFLRQMGLNPEHYLIDIGCGTLRGGIPIIDYLQEGRYFGVDVRASVLEEARTELREAGLEAKNPTLFRVADMSLLTLDRKFDYMWAFSVLVHMNDRILGETLAFVSRHLSEGGAFYANINIGDGTEGAWEGFPIVARSFDWYVHACAANNLTISDLGSLRSLGHVSHMETQDYQRMIEITAKTS